MKNQEMKHFKQDNAGRSMTEMLGVLAIIGVISVGGITGYRLAMNYYAANQIAQEINILRTDAKVKIARGGWQKLSLGAPYDSDTGGHLKYDDTYKISFGFTADSEMPEEDESINGYYVELSDIPKNICKPLANLLKNMNEQAEFEGECNQETNNTLYVAFEAENLSGENTETQPEETPEPEAPTPCEQNCEGGYCNKSGECIICGERIWDPDNEKCICPNNGHWNDVRCVSDDECTGGQKWSDDAKECVCPENNQWDNQSKECVENPCGKCYDDQFCLSTGCNNSENETGCQFSCVSLSGYTKQNTGTYVISKKDKQAMNWWSARRFCMAHNLPMMLITDLKCKIDITPQTQCGDKIGEGYCHKEDSISLCDDPSETNVSYIITELQSKWGSKTHGFWLFNSNGSKAYTVGLKLGGILLHDRNATEGFALCSGN